MRTDRNRALSHVTSPEVGTSVPNGLEVRHAVVRPAVSVAIPLNAHSLNTAQNLNRIPCKVPS